MSYTHPVVPPYLSFLFNLAQKPEVIFVALRHLAQIEERPLFLVTCCAVTIRLSYLHLLCKYELTTCSVVGRTPTMAIPVICGRTFSSVSRSRRRSESVSPFRTLTLYRIAVEYYPHTIFVQRGSVDSIFLLYGIKHTSHFLKSQIGVYVCNAYNQVHQGDVCGLAHLIIGQEVASKYRVAEWLCLGIGYLECLCYSSQK
jgi:hypothetical protein